MSPPTLPPTGPRSAEPPQPEGEPTGLLALAIRRPVGVTMIVLACLVFGLVGYLQLPVTLLPDLSYPTVTVRTKYEGASPVDVEDRISEPIREAVSVLSKVVKVTSISRAGQSDVIVEFAWGTPMVYAVGDLREKVDRVFLPAGAETPLTLRYDPSLDPILTIGLTGNLDEIALREVAEDELERELPSEVEGIAAVKVKGGDEKEILVAIDPAKLSALGLDIRQIAQRLGAENLNASAGILEEGETEYLVRALNEFGSLDEVRELIVARRNETNLRLSDVGEVRETAREPDVITRIDGRPAVLVEVYKEADANLVGLAHAVKDELFGTEDQRAYVRTVAEARKRARSRRPKKDTEDKDRDEQDPAKSEKGKTEGVRATDGSYTKVDLDTSAKGSAKDARDASQKTEGSGKEDAKDSTKREAAKGDSAQDDAEKKKAARAKAKRERDARFGAQFHHKRMTDYIAYRLPKGVEAKLLTDPSRYIESSIGEVVDAALVGGLLAVLVLFLFLRAGRPTLLISLAIPLSVCITFAPLNLSGVSLNVMSLGGLALGIGMLVDTSIVVLESITRCREEGDDLLTAAFRGVRQVSSAVIASTLTTVAVFLPIVFVEGIAGQLFRDQALAVVFSLLVSLLVALFLIPMLASRGAKRAAGPPPVRGRIGRTLGYLPSIAIGFAMRRRAGGSRIAAALVSPFTRGFAAVYEPIERSYPGFLRAALSARGLVLLVALAGCALAAWRLPALGSEVLPQVHEGEFDVQLFGARDLDVETTDRVVRPLERQIRALEGVAHTFLVSGVGRDELRSSEEGRHSARVHVVLATSDDVVALEEAVRSRIRALVEKEPAVEDFRFANPTLFSFRTPVSVEVYGHDLVELRRATKLVEAKLATLPGLRDLRSTMSRGNTEVVLGFDREKLARYGLEIGEATRRVAAMVQGEVPTRFTDRDRKVDMRVRLDPAKLGSVSELRRLDLAAAGMAPILLGSVAELRFLEGPSEIRRLGSRRAAEVEATLVGLDLGHVQLAIEGALAGLSLPETIDLQIGGQREEMERSRAGMLQALLLAVFLVYVVMATQFESLVQPLIIIFAVPLAFIGVVLTLDLFSIPISVVVFIGAIMLAGIVVNNAIVLIDRMNQERAAGKSVHDAVVDGARVRLRPVLMTTATTVLGLLPLTGALGGIGFFGAAGEGVELRAPMAVTVISGLIASTLLTLVVIPVLYSLVVRDAAVAEEEVE